MNEPRPDPKARSIWALLRPDVRFVQRFITWKSVVLSGAAVGVAVLGVVMLGVIDISADQPDGWLARNLLHHVFKSSVAFHSHRVVAPDDLMSPGRAMIGAQHFDMVCANCHGRPGFGQSVTALSMSPRPQYLPRVVDQFTDAELYRIVKHGVKYSAMPSWPNGARVDEVWSMVAFLRRLPKLDAKAYAQMTALPDVAGSSLAPSSSGGAALLPANAERNTPPVNEFLYAAPASGFGDAGVHTNPLATCARCHGADGTGAATGGEAPNLTLQDSGYLRAALKAYVSGGRRSGFMQTVAAQLSDDQISALAGHYDSLPVRALTTTPAAAEVVRRGEAIALNGLRERALPACANCHETEGARVSGAPRLAGQSAVFLRRELAALRRGGRGSTVRWNPMPAEAHDLDDRDIAALAAYYSTLPPGKGRAVTDPLPRAAAAPIGDLRPTKAIFDERCVKCHLDGGRGDATGLFPNLTINARPFVAQALFSMRTRARPNDKMTDVVDGLTLDQLSDLSAYVGGLAPVRTSGKMDPAAGARGAVIATKGLSDRRVPACLSCHDAAGVKALPLIPRLQGQNAAYLRNRLDNFSLRYDVDRSALNPMPTIAGRLTEQQRVDLANYFASAPLVEKPATTH